MKKILIDINSVVPYLLTGKTTGVGRTTLELIDSFSKMIEQLPFQIILYSQNMKGVGAKHFVDFYKTKHLYLPHRESINKIMAKLPIKESFSKYDLMHIPHNFAHIYKPEKAIITLHDALFMRIQEKAYNHNQMVQDVPPLMQQCKGIITCSKASKKDIIETMQIEPSKIDVVYWGVKHNVFYKLPNNELLKRRIKAVVKTESPYFLSVSCNAERKNTHKLVEAYIQLSKQLPINDLVLLWGNPPDFVLEMIDKSKCKERIHFISNITDTELCLVYNGATALVFPSSYEGFGLPVLEAMACGCAVVTCNNSSLKEVGGNAALYLKYSETEDIFEKLEQFENKNFDLDKIKEQGFLQASKFNWTDTALKYISIYNKHLDIN
ncbi:glycosyltransferase family 4 protein [Polaribacter sp. L3A8]|uniref:glycosyltransferase family 4 protein n=1 Tax=Polaribacter sp. L3A8 TaxID=2686361 RepID=UPI00131E1666|nr:glycosyltransferase family 1 protein [Polaribacter sp. L3A8]